MSDKINMVILAAGKGTRLKINTPKPLLMALGRSMVDFVASELASFSIKTGLKSSFNFVVGHEKELVQNHITSTCTGLNPEFFWQKEQLGTGHALQTFFQENEAAWESKYTLVACADTPLITADVFEKLYNTLRASDLDAVAATFKLDNPHGLGRIERDASTGFSIIEEKDANESQREIKEVNSALYIFKTQTIKDRLAKLDSNNKSGEFYLTDLFKKGDNVQALAFEDPNSFLGVNTLLELENVQKQLLKRKLNQLALSGVRFMNSDTVYLEDTVEVAPGSVIFGNVSLMGQTIIRANAVVESGVVIKNSIIGEDNLIKANCYIEGTVIAANCQVGPMARLREGTILKEDCKVGNFVEMKKAELSKGVKVSHLSYIGDAEIGEETNIGCGFITCNYDGANKHKTIIGKNSFIGSDCQMIAPIEIGDEVFIGSGSTINQNVPDGAFAIARQKQVTKLNGAKQFLKTKK